MLMKILGDDPARWRVFLPDYDYEPCVQYVSDGKVETQKSKRTVGKVSNMPQSFLSHKHNQITRERIAKNHELCMSNFR